MLGPLQYRSLQISAPARVSQAPAISLSAGSTNLLSMTFAEIHAALESAEPDKRFSLLGDPFAHLTALALLTTIIRLPLFAIDLPAPGFSARFTKHSMPPEAKAVFGKELGKYRTWRRLLLDCQLLATGKAVDADPWDSLRRLARLVLSRQAANNIYNASARLPAGLAPWQIDRELVLKVDAALPDERRAAFRAGLRIIDKLHGVELARASGLLPSVKIGLLPKPTAHEMHIPLPTQLQRLFAAAPQPVRSAIPFVWRLAVAGGVFKSVDDTAPRDLVAPPQFQRLLALDPRHFGFMRPSAKTYRVYLYRIARHVDPLAGASPEADPVVAPWQELFRCAERAGAAQTRIAGLRAVSRIAIEERLPPGGLTAEWCQERLARQGPTGVRCFRYGCYLLDDLADDPAVPSVLLPAEPTGVERIRGPQGAGKATTASVAAAPSKTYADPVEAAWVGLFAAARAVKIDKQRLHPLYTLKVHAVTGGIAPCAVDTAFLVNLTQQTDHRTAAKLNASARLLDALQQVPSLRPLLPTSPIGDLPDRRRNAAPLSSLVAAELETLLDLQGAAPSTRRAAGIAVRTLAEQHHAATSLDELIALDLDAIDWGGQVGQAPRYIKSMRGLRQFRLLPWTPPWGALQAAVVAAGVGMAENPVPALLAQAQGRRPQDLDLAWARAIDNQLRRPNSLSKHGRADLALTFARNVARLDALHIVPALADSGVLPPRIGPIRT